MRLVPTRRRLLSGICTLVVLGGLVLVSAPPAWAISTNPASLDFGKVRTRRDEDARRDGHDQFRFPSFCHNPLWDHHFQHDS